MSIQNTYNPDAFREVVLKAFYKFYKGTATTKTGQRFKVSAIDIWKEITKILERSIDYRRELSPVLSYLCQTGHIKNNKDKGSYSITPKGLSLFEGKSKFMLEYQEVKLIEKEEIEMPTFDFIKKKKLVPILIRDYTEIVKCIKSEYWKSAIILCGSAIEAILYDLLKQNESEALSSKSAQKSKGSVLPLEEWKLNSLINTASELSFVSKGIEGLT